MSSDLGVDRSDLHASQEALGTWEALSPANTSVITWLVAGPGRMVGSLQHVPLLLQTFF